ncbi:hypothetical protein [Streptomyces sp. TLI_105]|uniref:hypothetical protein n=1 Tax=Streptomyces sp. TLI_105 TaxID=1881019 RepID=UPI0008972D61|nr:hypothetical protein [Streptomyces sp. TLI_105]SEE59744.1 hypothetical protein SAMN05428939_8059 [Streptomyces sp. TLI_105]
MSEWGIALIAAGSAILGSIVTGWFAWKAGHRQATAAEAAGQAQAAALISTVQATLNEQRRARTEERRRRAYAEFLSLGDEWRETKAEEDGTRMLTAYGLVEIEGPVDLVVSAANFLSATNDFATNQADISLVLESRAVYVRAVRQALNEA